ncbi:phosphonate C-P lyase system protein PhnH [Lentibacillus cibarius]|uniref:Phosphonate C-P lyase system protein PhnH n=1 Tax=Lentibacillus cibarius TaxID=2583219 RepID=A0A5S3QL23_9BACI|nr:phosphonate C-P lyase system protein PhnH [Lentibacillus cibarius]TMN22632.1 phosphonate C-P lyase system protein PhnH [Lentibacillus cibarius]
MAMVQTHDLQQVYRKLLHSMSRPGTISVMEENVHQPENGLPCNHASFLTMMTLLDGEVTFHILSENQTNLHNKIPEYTLAKPAPIDEADYIIALRGVSENEVIQAMKQCKIGNLIDPQHSATWIIECETLSNDGELVLAGPGIKEKEQLHTSITKNMWKARNERTKEYPLGVDVIFTDEMARIACVPRTTSLSFSEVR